MPAVTICPFVILGDVSDLSVSVEIKDLFTAPQWLPFLPLLSRAWCGACVCGSVERCDLVSPWRESVKRRSFILAKVAWKGSSFNKYTDLFLKFLPQALRTSIDKK